VYFKDPFFGMFSSTLTITKYALVSYPLLSFLEFINHVGYILFGLFLIGFSQKIKDNKHNFMLSSFITLIIFFSLTEILGIVSNMSRYYLPLAPFICIYAGIGLSSFKKIINNYKIYKILSF
jgi:hypothetical protein